MPTRQIFKQKLQRLQDEVLFLGSMVEAALIEAVKLLKERDMAGSHRLIAEDRHLNEKRFAIENNVLTLIATQQPVAGDMRVLAAMLEISTELERIGDYAKGIANINLMIGEAALLRPLDELSFMAEKARAMLHRSLDAFVQRNVELAQAIPAADVEVDELYNQAYRKLLAVIIANPGLMDQATCQLWAAHNLKRTVDRVINICERVVFTVTGEIRELSLNSNGSLYPRR